MDSEAAKVLRGKNGGGTWGAADSAPFVVSIVWVPVDLGRTCDVAAIARGSSIRQRLGRRAKGWASRDMADL